MMKYVIYIFFVAPCSSLCSVPMSDIVNITLAMHLSDVMNGIQNKVNNDILAIAWLPCFKIFF